MLNMVRCHCKVNKLVIHYIKGKQNEQQLLHDPNSPAADESSCSYADADSVGGNSLTLPEPKWDELDEKPVWGE